MKQNTFTKLLALERPALSRLRHRARAGINHHHRQRRAARTSSTTTSASTMDGTGTITALHAQVRTTSPFAPQTSTSR